MNGSNGKVACTIVSKNYLHYARTLMQSVGRTNPDWARHVLLVDTLDGEFDPSAEPFTLHTVDDLPLPDRQQFLYRYDVLELNTAVKPWFIERLFDAGARNVVYLDPDVRVYRPLTEVEDLLDGGLMALTPHLTDGLDATLTPTEHDILKAGSYNLGFLALARHPHLERFLKWWRSKLEFDCRVSLADNLFVDQRWMDLAPGMFPDVRILRHEGYNVAYWNLHHREVRETAGGIEVNGLPLVFFHFSGLDLDAPEGLSKHQNRFRLSELPTVAALVRDYVAANRANGADVCRTWPYAFGRLGDGTPIASAMRQFYRSRPALRESIGGNPFDHDHDYLNRPWGTQPQPLVTDLMRQLWESRDDLQAAFPDIDGGHRVDFALWFVNDTTTGAEFAERFVAPVRESLAAHLAAGERGAAGGRSGAPGADPSAAARCLRGLLRWAVLASPVHPTRNQLRAVYRVARPLAGPLPRWLKLGGLKADLRRWMAEKRVRRRLIRQPAAGIFQLITSWVRGLLTRRLPAPPGRATAPAAPAGERVAHEPAAPGTAGTLEGGERDVLPFRLPATGAGAGTGVDIVGYVRSEHGIGQSARLCAAAAHAAEIPFTLHDFGHGNLSRETDRSWEGHITTERRHRVAVVHVNADQLPAARRALGRNFFHGGYTVGFWHWELPVFPEQWIDSFSLVDEVWVPSQFVAEAVRARSDRPVVTMPHAIDFRPDPAAKRGAFGLPRDRFLFLTMYDVLSTRERKNPEAAIAAYREAFPSTGAGTGLVIKVNNPERDRRAVAALRAATRGRVDILVADRILSRQDVYNLESLCDAFVSLHRSEGFGLGLAESMFLGKPVVGTDWSGNREFMNANNSCPVDYRLVRLARAVGPYAAGQVWAEPDVHHAAGHMKRLVGDAAWRRQIGRAAERTIRERLSPAVVGAKYRERLAEIHAHLGTAAGPPGRFRPTQSGTAGGARLTELAG